MIFNITSSFLFLILLFLEDRLHVNLLVYLDIFVSFAAQHKLKFVNIFTKANWNNHASSIKVTHRI